MPGKKALCAFDPAEPKALAFCRRRFSLLTGLMLARLRRVSPAYLIAAFILITAIGVYSNALDNDYVYDDKYIVQKNPLLQGQGNPVAILRSSYWGPVDRTIGFYRPLSILSFLLDTKLFGSGPLAHHLVNVILHAANSILIFSFLRLIGMNLRIAGAAALLFAVHAVHTEVVTLIVGRLDLLSFFFGMFALLLRLVPRNSNTARTLIGFMMRHAFPLSLVCFSLALLSKENAVLFLGFMVVVDFHQEVDAVEPTPTPNPLLTTIANVCKRNGLQYAGYATIFFVYLLLRYHFTGRMFSVLAMPYSNTILLESSYDGFLTALKTIYRYAVLLFYPRILSLDYGFNHIFPARSFLEPTVLAGFGILAGLLSSLILSYKRNKNLFLGLMFFTIGFIPFVNIFFPLTVIMAERLLYLSSFGFVVVLANLWGRLYELSSFKLLQSIAYLLLLAILSLHAWRTWTRNDELQNQHTAFLHTVRTAPRNAKAHYNLGVTYMKSDDIELARRHFRRAMKINPLYSEPELSLAVLYIKEGAPDTALAMLRRLRRNDPEYAAACHNLALLYLRLGRLKESAGEFRDCIRIQPRNPEHYLNVAHVVLKNQKPGEAIYYASLALQFKPRSARAYVLLTLAHLARGDVEKARRDFTRLQEIDPRNKSLLQLRRLFFQMKNREKLPIRNERLRPYR